MRGLTLDTGALIALERRHLRATRLVDIALERGQLITIPSPVVIEWWRGPSRRAELVLGIGRIEPLAASTARAAGEALAETGPGPSPTDAAVMASAAARGDTVLTSDVDDLELLRQVFPSVRILRV